MSRTFAPSGSIVQKGSADVSQGLTLLFRAGLIRQSASGIFSLLPLGRLIVDKIERLIDLYMQRGLGSSRLSLPLLASRDLWETTGRWQSQGSELFRLKDRKGAEFCLSPTHEESVTKVVAAEVNSFRQLPVRVHQQTTKFRDELRPRGGLLRGKEFLMKDLYTFDTDVATAHATYADVNVIYRRLFDRLGIDYEVAVADSGAIGGDLNHEYHVPSPLGEDTLLKCGACGYTANQELARTDLSHLAAGTPAAAWQIQRFAHPTHRDTLFYEVRVPEGRQLDRKRLARLADPQLDQPLVYLPGAAHVPHGREVRTIENALDALVARAGDACPTCASHASHNTAASTAGPIARLDEMRTIECGHTFHLGDKYTRPLNFRFTTSAGGAEAFAQMGCHGIGVTRLVQVLAQALHDAHGLRWPVGLEPLPRVVIPTKPEYLPAAENVARRLIARARSRRAAFDSDTNPMAFEAWDDYGAIDGDMAAVVDDRFRKTWGWRVNEAELVGAREVYIVGKSHPKDGSQADRIVRGATPRNPQQVDIPAV